jgi:hypothetical protein
MDRGRSCADRPIMRLDLEEIEGIARGLIAPAAAELLDAVEDGNMEAIRAIADELSSAARAIVMGRV